MDRRDFLKRFGLGAASLGAGAALGDEWVDTAKSLPEGSVGDPRNVWFGQRIFPIPHTIEDGPSCRIENGKIILDITLSEAQGEWTCAMDARRDYSRTTLNGKPVPFELVSFLILPVTSR